MSPRNAALISLLLIFSAVLVACGGGTAPQTSTTSAPTEPAASTSAAAAPSAAPGGVVLLELQLEELELEDVDISEALSSIVEALEGIDFEILDLSDLGLDQPLFDVSALPEGGAELEFDQFDLATGPGG